MSEDNDILSELHLDNPELDREWMACTKHPSCTIAQGEVEVLYETLSSYDRSELSEEQSAFLDWVEFLQK